MDSKLTQRRFLDLFEGQLTEEERLVLEDELDTSPELNREYTEYRALAKLEELIASEDFYLEEDLSEIVLDTIEDKGMQQEAHAAYFRKYHVWIGSLMSVNVALLAVLVTLLARGPVATPSAPRDTQVQVASSDAIVPGFRPVTIDVAMPKKFHPERVDIRVAYERDGRRQLHDLARFVKVLDIKDAHDSDVANARLTLLVPDEAAERITLARLVGELDLLLSSPIASPKPQGGEQVTIRDPSGRPIVENAARSTFAVLYLPERDSGVPVRQVYYEGHWHRHYDMRAIGF